MDQQKMRERLESERRDLISQQDTFVIANENQSDDYGVSQHSADNATELFLRERNITLRNNADDLIAQIDAALQRIDDGSYGTCERCGRQINEERLETLPYATRCIDCQSIVEG